MNGERRCGGAVLVRGAAPALAAALALTLTLLGSSRAPKVAAEVGSGPAQTHAYTDLAVPAEDVVMLGASSSEPGAPAGATWGIGQLRENGQENPELVRYVPPAGGAEGEWEPGPELPAGFAVDHPMGKPSPLEGQVTGEGYGVLAGTIAREGKPLQTVLVRKPGGAFEVTPPVMVEGEAAKTEGEGGEAAAAGAQAGVKAGGEPGGEAHEEPLLHKGQTLFGSNRAPMIAPLAEGDGSAGALVAPVYAGEGVDEFVLHWDGRRWTREPIEIPAASEKAFKVLAVAAAGPGEAWLLARLSSAYGSGAVALFRRVKTQTGGTEEGSEGEGGGEEGKKGEGEAGEGDGWRWEPVEVETGPGQVALALSVPVSGGVPAWGEPFSVFGAEGSQIAVQSQLLTVTSDGVWVDGVRTDVERQQPYTTMYVRPQVGAHGEQRGVIEQSWCKAAAETPPCQQTLPREPPLNYGRSIAWQSAAPYGERVITGLAEGVVLRLQGGAFESVLSIGGEEAALKPEGVPGLLYGAAFTAPGEGWLGYSVPVRLTPSAAPERFAAWPVATRHPLLAIAPQPGAPVAALTSEAVAVGESGGVVRYKPGEGWLPETLFGPGERVEKPFLRAVAWPSANRVYAVGQEGEMWLWRGETGLWERDPATPINFRANLYGIAFDPANSARGYAVGTRAVGSGGVLLRYGKTWTEETALPAEVANAQFDGVAFAGSQALVAFNVQRGENEFDGGLLVNGGGGWSVDEEERKVTGGARVRAVAGLPDGGAAVLAGQGTVRLYERESQSAPWRQESVPLRSGVAGSLALYRQSDGTLRALLATGGASGVTKAIPFEPSPGSPPYEQPAAGVGAGTGPTAGDLLRQTATGWSDEVHDVNPVLRGRTYNEYDEPVHPDPLVATLVSPTGGEAWVVGGITSGRENEQTADIARYPASGRPPNEGLSRIPIEPEEAGSGGPGVTTLAFGGGAGCADPCAERVLTGVGPDVWLAKAVSIAQGAGASAFFYTGPMVHYAPYEGQSTPRPPFGEEYERYAAIFGTGPAPVYAVSSEGEIEGERALPGAFEGLASPLGSVPASGWQAANASPSRAEREGCGCAKNYYAVQNAHVEAIVLDDAAEGGVEPAQRVWLEQQLQQAGTARRPVIVIAEADLGRQLAPGKHDEAAEALFAALVGRDPDGQDPGGYAASAYFYDAPEQNVAGTISFAGASLPAFGSGTLGYGLEAHEETAEFHGAKGILLGEVRWGAASAAEKAVDRAPVAPRLIPVIEELAIEPVEGTLLRRSEAALFRGLARRPRAGCRGQGTLNLCEEGQYIPIPSICVGVTCSEAVLPEYEFRSSRPEVGGFVKLNTASTDELFSGAFVPTNAVLVNANGEAVKDGREEGGEQVGATSGLFCAYNKGETNVTISAGGLSYTLPVRVQAGSVRQPCGTVPAKQEVAASATAVPPPAPAPAPAGSAPAAAPPIVPVPPPPPPATAPPARPAPFLLPPAPSSPPLAFVPPPIPTPARPTPPTGTSAVTSPVEIAEHEEDEEHATESVSNQALSYRAPEHEPSPAYTLGIVLLAAFAGASIRARMRRGRRELRVAPATLNTMRAQRRLTREPPRR